MPCEGERGILNFTHMSRMPSRHTRAVTLLMVGALIVCHVVGPTCFMDLTTVAMADTTLQQMPGPGHGHGMATEKLCSDSIPPSKNSFAADEPSTMTGFAGVAPTRSLVSSAGLLAGLAPPTTGPPLYTRLSTFRI